MDGACGVEAAAGVVESGVAAAAGLPRGAGCLYGTSQYGYAGGGGYGEGEYLGLVVASAEAFEPVHRYGDERVDAGECAGLYEAAGQHLAEVGEDVGPAVVFAATDYAGDVAVVCVGEPCVDAGYRCMSCDARDPQVCLRFVAQRQCGDAVHAQAFLVGEQVAAAYVAPAGQDESGDYVGEAAAHGVGRTTCS